MPIHPTAIVDPDARVDAAVRIGPHVVVESDVEIGKGSVVGANAVLKSGLRLGERVHVHEAVVLGGEPQDLKFRGAPSYAVVGAGSVIREFATVHRSVEPEGVTRLGRDCFVMGYGHIAHDCDIGDEAVIASYAALAGHIRVGHGAFVSGGVVIHQFSRIGELAMVGGGSKVNLDVPPFLTVDGFPARAVGLNTVGLRRAGVGDDDIRALKRAYRTLYREKLRREEALDRLQATGCALVDRLVAFVRESERGICRAKRR